MSSAGIARREGPGARTAARRRRPRSRGTGGPGTPTRAVGATLLALTLSPALTACGRPEALSGTVDARVPEALPMVLHGMPLVSVLADDDAATLIRGLHGQDVASEASYVGRYRGGGAEATLYVSRLVGDGPATALVQRMADAIGDSNAEFAHHTRFSAGGHQIHAVLGQGQIHFFFTRGPEILWLAIDRRMARVGLSDLLGLEPGEIPTGVVAGGIDILPPPDLLYRRPNDGALTSGGR